MIRAAPLILLALPAMAADPDLSGAPTLVETQPLASHRVATGPWDGSIPFETVEGQVTRRVWQIDASDRTALQILDPLRDDLTEAGYEIVFMCATRACGGFDFRFGIDVTPAPDMFVDLATFRYLAARRGEEWVTLLVSVSGSRGYVQQTVVGPAEAGTPGPAPIDAGPAATVVVPGPAALEDIAATLARTGRAVLGDVDFAVGSTDLEAADYGSLDALANLLRADPSVTMALVGHTDIQGGADANLVISRRRAEAVRTLLIARYGIAADRLETFGAAYFAPLAANDTEAGRNANRRVEAVITSEGRIATGLAADLTSSPDPVPENSPPESR